MIRGIGHAAFRVADMEKAVAFYCETAGFTKAFEIANDDGKPWIVYLYAANGQFIELFYGGEKSGCAQNGEGMGYRYLCLGVADIAQTETWLLKRGCTVAPHENGGLRTTDPDGNVVLFAEQKAAVPLSDEKTIFTGLSRMAFAVESLDASLRFYRDILGFAPVESNTAQHGVCLRVCDGQVLECIESTGAKRQPPPANAAGFMHMCLEVDNIDEIAAHVTSLGCTLHIPPKQGKDHNWQCWTRDPDGNPIEFMCLDARSPQAEAIRLAAK